MDRLMICELLRTLFEAVVQHFHNDRWELRKIGLKALLFLDEFVLILIHNDLVQEEYVLVAR